MSNKISGCISIIWIVIFFSTWVLLPIDKYAFAQRKFSISLQEQGTPAVDTAKIYELLREAKRMLVENKNNTRALLEQARRLSVDAHFPDGIAESMLSLGEYYAEKKDWHSALKVIRESLRYCQHATYRKNRLLVDYHMLMARCYSSMGRGDSAAYYLQEAEKHTTALKNTSALIAIYCNMGAMWIENARYDYAIDYLQRAEKLSISQKNDRFLPNIYLNLASIYSYKNNNVAKKYTIRALDIALKKGNILVQREAYTKLGRYFNDNKKPVEAIENFEKAIKLGDSLNPLLSLFPKWGIGFAYLELNKLPEAEHYLLEVQAILEKSGTKIANISQIYLNLADVYRRQGNAEKAFSYMKIYANQKDDRNYQEINKAMDELETKYKISEKNREIADQKLLLSHQQNSIRNRNSGIILISAGSIALAVLWYMSRRNSKRKMQILVQEEKIKKLNAMMEGAEKERGRIAGELHDGIGSLLSAATININSLGDEFTEISEHPLYRETDMLVREISKEVRKAAHNLMPDILQQHNFQEAVRLHCAHITRGKNLDIEVQDFGDFSILTGDYKLSVYRIIQELLQNILKHAKATVAVVQMHIDHSLLSLTIEDNGIGYDSGINPTGIGLQNIKTRVEHMNGRLTIDTGPGEGTSVYIEVDLD